MSVSKFTTMAGALQAGDRIGRVGAAPVRYVTLTDTGAAFEVYVHGYDYPRRYGRNEVVTAFRVTEELSMADINKMSRAEIQARLESEFGTAVFDDEPMSDLRECLYENVNGFAAS